MCEIFLLSIKRQRAIGTEFSINMARYKMFVVCLLPGPRIFPKNNGEKSVKIKKKIHSYFSA